MVVELVSVAAAVISVAAAGAAGRFLPKYMRWGVSGDDNGKPSRGDVVSADTEFNRLIHECGLKVLQKAEQNAVIAVIGPPGSGKSTILKYLFHVEGAVPGEGDDHVTCCLQIHKDPNGMVFADTIGKSMDAPGIMRVLACIYCQGWDPHTIVVVHKGRLAPLELTAKALNLKTVNSAQIEAHTFYQCLENNSHDLDGAFGLALSEHLYTDHGLSHVATISRFTNTEDLKQSGITNFLLNMLSETRPKNKDELQRMVLNSDDTVRQQIIPGGMEDNSFQTMVKCIVARIVWKGTDLEFLEAPDIAFTKSDLEEFLSSNEETYYQ